MSQQTINVGAAPNDGTGTPLRTAFQYTNSNFTELYTALGGGAGLPGATTQVIFNDGGTNLAGDAGLTYNKTTDTLSMGAASITGDLTAARLNVTGATIPANGMYLASANTVAFSANSLSQFAIAPLGVFSWFDGAGGTRMTLNSNGLIRGGTTPDIVSSETTTLTNIGNIGAAHGATTGTYFVAKVGAANGIVELKADARSGAYPPMVFTTGGTERLRIDSSGNVGIGVTPSAWSGVTALQISRGSFAADTGSYTISQNVYNNGGNKYIASAAALQFQAIPGTGFLWYTAPSGTAGNAVTFTQAMTLDASGNLCVGTATAVRKLTVYDTTATPAQFESSTTDCQLTLVTSSGSGGKCFIQASAGALLLGSSASERARIDANGNFMVGVSAAGTTAAKTIQIANGTAPTANITGGQLYVEAGALKYRGSSGTVTTIANA